MPPRIWLLRSSDARRDRDLRLDAAGVHRRRAACRRPGRPGRGRRAVPWDDSAADWSSFASVVIRSTWDYSQRRDEFVAWADSVGSAPPQLARRHPLEHRQALPRRARSGGPAGRAHHYIAPGDPVPELDGEVVKPTVSAGAKDSGRFSEGKHDEARALIDHVHRSGRTAMVSPIRRRSTPAARRRSCCLDGEPAHVLRKPAVLRPDEVAPVRDDAVGAAEVMYDPNLVVAGEAARRSSTWRAR